MRGKTIALFCATLVACGQDTSEAFIASAKSYLNAGQPAAAVVELRNALQNNPGSPEARFLLGKALLDQGSPTAAAIEFNKASELRYAADKVVPMLARALLLSGEQRKVVALEESVSLSSAEAIADFKLGIAQARAQLGQAAEAEEALRSALSAKPDHAPALAYQARRLANKGDFAAASKVIDDVLAQHPDDADALVVKGDILRDGSRDLPGAVKLYRKALAAKPRDLLSATALVEALLMQKEDAEAAKELEVLSAARPRHPQILYFQALIAGRSGDFKRAEDLAQQLLKIAPDDVNVLRLAGQIALHLGRPLLAQTRLGQVVSLAPDWSVGRELLARAYLNGADPAKALEVLEPVLRAPSVNAATLVTAAGAQLLLGDYRSAQALYGRAAKLGSASAQARTGAAVARAVRGEDSEGVRELETISAANKGFDADMTLVSMLMARRQFDLAIKALDRLETKPGGKALARHLRGQVLMVTGDLHAARRALEQALSADPDFYPAVDRLAALDWREGKPAAARERLAAFAKKHPDDYRALVGLAHVQEQSGQPHTEVVETLTKAVSLKPEDRWVRRQLVHYLLGKGEYQKALSAAQEASNAIPANTDMQELLATAQLAAGDIHQAITAFGALVAKRPMLLSPLLGLADAYMANRSFAEAADAVQRASALAPRSLAVLQRGVQIDLANGQHNSALARIRAFQARNPEIAEGFALEGELLAARRNWAAAEAAYRKALQRQPAATPVAERLYAMLREAGERGKADAFAAQWTKTQPADARFRFLMSRMSIADLDYGLAETQLREVLKLDPNNATALNNLAWVLSAQKKTGALELAERATRLAPNQSNFMDTLAEVLAQNGQMKQALLVQQQAVLLAPTVPELRLALARLQLKSGNRQAARDAVEMLIKLDGRFAANDEVKAMLALR